MEQPHICFDRVIPAKYQAGKTSAHRNALSAFETAVRERSASLPNPPAKDAPFHEHLHAVESQHELSATDPIEIARMAVINAKKWDNGKHLRCKFLDGDDFQRKKVQEKATEWLKICQCQFQIRQRWRCRNTHFIPGRSGIMVGCGPGLPECRLFQEGRAHDEFRLAPR